MPRLRTRPIQGRTDLVAYFDESAADYREAHGDARRLLNYRLHLIRKCCTGASNGVLLEIGCGTAIHLEALTVGFSTAIGTDISPAMIATAKHRVLGSPFCGRIDLRVDAAEELRTVESASVDVVVCVGSLEHMLDKSGALRQVARVLRPGGRLVCLTLNGDYWWYSLAPWLAIPTRHLSTDRFLGRAEATALLEAAGLHDLACLNWTFIPKGDMPGWIVPVLWIFDALGRFLRVSKWRGGLLLRARKPAGSGRP
ncbi:MAG TPA: class I SAM-dependent methyltransferase [Bryobacteraceae bacterium]